MKLFATVFYDWFAEWLVDGWFTIVFALTIWFGVFFDLDF